MATVAEKLLTAEEFALMPDPGYPTELVRGRIVEMPSPGPRHGQVCTEVAFILRLLSRERDLGHVVGNDSGVITERGPDSVRGPDVAFYSYRKIAKGPLPDRYLEIAPDLVFEVMSPSDRWPKVLAKVAEFLEAGVLLVSVLRPKTSTAHLYHSDERVEILGPDDEWLAPEILGDFRVPVRRFFECD
jgi:Uma2 family endonuclease